LALGNSCSAGSSVLRVGAVFLHQWIVGSREMPWAALYPRRDVNP